MTTANPAAQPSSSEPSRLQRILLRQEIDPLHHPGRRRPAALDAVGRLPDPGEPPQSGSPGRRGRAHRPAHDAHHHHGRHRPVRGLHHGPGVHHARGGLVQLGPAPGAGHRRGPAHRHRLRPLQRPLHHEGRPAAAHHHPGHAGALPRTRGGHRPGAIRARLPGVVLHPGPEELPGRPDEHPQPAPHRGPGGHRHRRRPGLDALRPLPVRHRQQRDGGALQRPARAAQQAHHLHALRASCPAWRRGSTSRA